MNRRVWRYAAIGLGLYILFLIANAPASLLAWALARASDNTVTLQAVTGTLWRGSGELFYTRPHASSLSLGRGTWSLNPWWIFMARVGLTLDLKNAEVIFKSDGTLGMNGATVRNLDIRFPASLVPTVYPPAALAGPSGEVRITTKEFAFTRNDMDGQVIILWVNAATTVSNVKPLGDYRLQATGNGSSLSFALTTDRGELNLAGQGAWAMDARKLQVSGTATPSPKSAPTLDPLLRLMGGDQGEGRRSFAIDVSL